MLKTIFLTFSLATLVVIISTYVYLGGYKEADFSIGSRPSFFLVYKDILGPYEQTSFAIQEVEQLLQRQNIICKKTFGLYLDSPDKIVESDLRSKAGCLFDTKIVTDFNTMLLDAEEDVVIAKFNGSPALGPVKVYEPAKKWLGSKAAFPSLEVYTYNGNNELNTTYYFNVLVKDSNNEHTEHQD